MSSLKVHNAMWPGLVGKEEGTDHPPISLERMLEFTANAEVNGRKYDGIDYFLFHPHTDPDASEDDLKKYCRSHCLQKSQGWNPRRAYLGRNCWRPCFRFTI